MANTTIVYQPQEGNQYKEPLNPNGQAQNSYNTTIVVPQADDVAAPAAPAAQASTIVVPANLNNGYNNYNGYPGTYSHPTPDGPHNPPPPQGPGPYPHGQPAPIGPPQPPPILPPPLCACCTLRCRLMYMRSIMYMLLFLSIGLGINSIVIAIDDLSVLKDNTNFCVSGTDCDFLFGIIEYNDCCTCYDDFTGDTVEIFASQCSVADIYAEARIITFIIQVIIGLVCVIALCYQKYNILWSQVIYWTLIIIMAFIIGGYVGDDFFWLAVVAICLVLFAAVISMCTMIKTVQIVERKAREQQIPI